MMCLPPSIAAQSTEDIESAYREREFFKGLREQGRCLHQIDVYEAQTEEIWQESRKLMTATGKDKSAVQQEINRMSKERGTTYDGILRCAQTVSPPEGSRLSGDEPREYARRQFAEALDGLIASTDQLIKAYDELLAKLRQEQARAEDAQARRARIEESLKFVMDAASGDFQRYFLDKPSSGNN
jgi:hypothetical protein